jgi:hypothetical protein
MDVGTLMAVATGVVLVGALVLIWITGRRR